MAADRSNADRQRDYRARKRLRDARAKMGMLPPIEVWPQGIPSIAEVGKPDIWAWVPAPGPLQVVNPGGIEALPAQPIRDALEESLRVMKWIGPSDVTAVAMARSLADVADLHLREKDMRAHTAALRDLRGILNDLGGTPLVRLQHELRALRLEVQASTVKRPRAGGVTDGQAPALPEGVADFKRPPKRRSA